MAVPGFGFPVTSTATLRERAETYRLKIELARGKLNQLRNTVAEWEAQGLKPSPLVQSDYAAAHRSFCKAVQTHLPLESDAAALECLQRAYRAGVGYLRQFTDTAIGLRVQRERRLSTRWSCRITKPPSLLLATEFTSTFTAADVRPVWSDIEMNSSNMNWETLDRTLDWVESIGLRPTVGPIIDLAGPLPAWLDQCAGEVPSLSAVFCDFIESMVNRYRNRVKHWVLCSGFNHADRLGLTEDDRVRLVVRMLEAARSSDPDSRWVIGLSSPWGSISRASNTPTRRSSLPTRCSGVGCRLPALNSNSLPDRTHDRACYTMVWTSCGCWICLACWAYRSTSWRDIQVVSCQAR